MKSNESECVSYFIKRPIKNVDSETAVGCSRGDCCCEECVGLVIGVGGLYRGVVARGQWVDY